MLKIAKQRDCRAVGHGSVEIGARKHQTRELGLVFEHDLYRTPPPVFHHASEIEKMRCPFCKYSPSRATVRWEMGTDGPSFCFFPVTQTIHQVNTIPWMQMLQNTNEIVGCTTGSNIGEGGFCQQKATQTNRYKMTKARQRVEQQ